jgi:hypothetical protein
VFEKLIQFFRSVTALNQSDNYDELAANASWFPAWYNFFDQITVSQLTRDLFWNHCHASGCELVGYKEIRHGLPSSMNLVEFVAGLKSVFGTQIRFIFLTRPVDEIIESIRRTQWEAEPELREAELIFQQAAFTDVLATNQDCCSALTYEELTSDETKVRTALEFAGCKFSVEVWRKVLAIKVPW